MVKSAVTWFSFIPFLFSIEVGFGAELCEGHNPSTHNMGTEHFLTTSRVYSRNGVEVYETCVENLGSHDLWVDWLIPGPTTWILPGTAIPNARQFVTRDTIDATACLAYGNIGATIKEQYLAHAQDADALAGEEKGGCQAALAPQNAPSPAEAPQAVDTPIRLFVPSDREDPGNTMLQFKGLASTGWAQASPSTLALRYELTPIEGRKAGDPDEMTIRLAPNAVAKMMLPSGESEALLKGVPLGYTNDFNVEFAFFPNPTLRHARYEILDKDGRLVGAFTAPAWTEE